MIVHKKVFQRLQTKCGALRHSWQHVVHGAKKSAREEARSKDAGSNPSGASQAYSLSAIDVNISHYRTSMVSSCRHLNLFAI